MAVTTYYDIPLVDAGDRDFLTRLNRSLSAVTEKIRANQRPGAHALEWGDKTAGKYIMSTAAGGLKVVGGLDCGLAPFTNFVLEGDTAFPASPTEKQLFVRTDTNILYARLGGAWVAMGAVTGGTVAAAGGVLISDIGAGAGEKGNVPIYSAGGTIIKLVPSTNAGKTIVADATQTEGWRFGYIDTEFAKRLFTAKGQVFGATGNEAGAVLAAAGADGMFFLSDAAEATGLKWVAALTAMQKVFTAKGQILGGTGSTTGALVAGPTTGQVFVGDSTQPAGFRWADQSELGSIPGAQTNAFANVMATETYI